MKSSPIALALCLLVCAVWSSGFANESEMRTWTDSTGKFSFEGKFLELNGSNVVLLSPDGQSKRVPLRRLSRADQDWLRNQGSGAKVTLSEEDPLTGVAWYSSVEPAFEEARRSRRPIFFMAAATQCSGVPGVF